MRLTRIVFLSSLAAILGGTGCGGCDSCFGTAQPGDYDAAPTVATTTQPATPIAAEAGAAAVEGKDAAGEASVAAPTEPLPRPSAVPRPKAPMPLGAFQICGNYDGPLCTKDCPGGNCRQECDGVECVLNCPAGYCSQLCGPTGKCKLTCVGGHCVQACTKAEGCIKECSGGACE